MKCESVAVSHHGRTVHGRLYQPAGTAKRPFVLISHGYNGSMEDYESTASLLAENGVGALCCAFCGGSTRDKSGFPSTSMSLYTEKEDALAMLDFLRARADCGAVYLLGGSMGGMVSAMIAAQQPDMIAGLMLLYPAFCIPDDWNKRFKTEAEIPETVDFWNLKLGRVYFTTLRGLDIYEQLPRYRGRVLIIHGDRDNIVPLAYSQRAAKAFENAELRVFAGEGHGFSQSAGTQADQLILNFVRLDFSAAGSAVTGG